LPVFFLPVALRELSLLWEQLVWGFKNSFFVVLEELLQLGRGMENTNYVSTRSQQKQAAAAVSADVNNEGEYLVILVLGKRPKLSSSLLCLGG